MDARHSAGGAGGLPPPLHPPLSDMGPGYFRPLPQQVPSNGVHPPVGSWGGISMGDDPGRGYGNPFPRGMPPGLMDEPVNMGYSAYSKAPPPFNNGNGNTMPPYYGSRFDQGTSPYKHATANHMQETLQDNALELSAGAQEFVPTSMPAATHSRSLFTPNEEPFSILNSLSSWGTVGDYGDNVLGVSRDKWTSAGLSGGSFDSSAFGPGSNPLSREVSDTSSRLVPEGLFSGFSRNHSTDTYDPFSGLRGLVDDDTFGPRGFDPPFLDGSLGSDGGSVVGGLGGIDIAPGSKNRSNGAPAFPGGR